MIPNISKEIDLHHCSQKIALEKKHFHCYVFDYYS